MELTIDQLHNIVPPHLAVQAMRDNGYKNAAYAIAELMDNSIQAKASQVELHCGERLEQLSKRKGYRIETIAVLDNGCGMDMDVLRMALQFGNGTHLSHSDQTGIGKFGMGLPCASISQCRRVDVWSWKNGPDSALHTYIDIDEIKKKRLSVVPEPKAKEIDQIWRQVGKCYGSTGTLVVWTRLDRVMWKTAKSILDNSELLIGRMYRRFLHDARAKILLNPFDLDNPTLGLENVREAVPNDPLYLTAPTSCPEPFDNTPMFEKWGEHIMEVEYRDEKHPVKIIFSVAKPEARDEAKWSRNPGSHPHGKHAGKNIGVSIVRADRELELNESWTIKYDPTERWWGVELEFPPALDDLFGVTNNKQYARNFHLIDEETMLLDGESPIAMMDRLQAEGDPNYYLLEISKYIKNNLTQLRALIKTQKKSESQRRKRHKVDLDEQHATDETRKRQQEGHLGSSDEDEARPADQRKEEIKQSLEEEGLTEAAANELAQQVVDCGLKYKIVEAELEVPAFFSVKPKAGTLIITLNTSHSAYRHLMEVILEEDENETVDDLRQRLSNARSGLKLLLMAWARYEDELSGSLRSRAQDARFDWGRIARQFLERND